MKRFVFSLQAFAVAVCCLAAPTSKQLSASKVAIKDGQRYCIRHDSVALLIAKGFADPPEVECALPTNAVLLAYSKYSAEFPNPFGWSVSRSPYKGSVEVHKEFCPTCENAFQKRVTELEIREHTK